MKLIFLILSIFISSIFADTNNTTDINTTNKHIEDSNQRVYIDSINDIDNKLKDNLWIKNYNNYKYYKSLKEEHLKVKQLIKKELDKEKLQIMQKKEEKLQSQLTMMSEYKDGAFEKLMKFEEIPALQDVTNPFGIFSALSYINQIGELRKSYKEKSNELKNALDMMKTKKDLIHKYEHNETNIATFQIDFDEIDFANDSYLASLNIFNKKIDDNIQKAKDSIKNQLNKLFYVFLIIVISVFISFLLKIGSKKYVHNDDVLYTLNKIINVTNITIIMIAILFVYIDNVTYLVTVLGFASAGVAIAMKDWFMSILGWIVIILSGIIKVGDRIKVTQNNQELLGDVLDISPIRITIYEDITLLSVTKNRRAGRIIFVPNNFVFTQVMLNYSHSSLKTVWDGIDITITFDSNHKKASHIAKEVAKKYSKGYTEITRKQFETLKERYNIRNSNVEPRVFSFADDNGIKISVWYLTNSFATLTLRSTISSEIIDEFQKEDDITIAYNTQKIFLEHRNEGLHR